MSIDINIITNLIKDYLTFSDEREYHITLLPDASQVAVLKELDESGCIEEFSDKKGIIFASNLRVGEEIKVKLVNLRLERLGFYNTIKRLVDAHPLTAPDSFYLRDLDYMNGVSELNAVVTGYFSMLKLSDCLISLALFKNEVDGLTLYLMQERIATTLKISNSVEIIKVLTSFEQEVNSFCKEIFENIERKKIYQKELIDFLNDYETENRYATLCTKFGIFFEQCQSAYGFFLSDFSYGKLKLEIESTVLDYSKNIRSIINDSQTKLIAIPAAFLVASGQLTLDTPFSAKNILIVIASLVFSILIEIFIRNQKSSLTIFTDNVKNYKTTFGFKNRSVDSKVNSSLKDVINTGFSAIDKELKNQESRLSIIQCINWGMSVLLIMIILISYSILHFGGSQ